MSEYMGRERELVLADSVHTTVFTYKNIKVDVYENKEYISLVSYNTATHNYLVLVIWRKRDILEYIYLSLQDTLEEGETENKQRTINRELFICGVLEYSVFSFGISSFWQTISIQNDNDKITEWYKLNKRTALVMENEVLMKVGEIMIPFFDSVLGFYKEGKTEMEIIKQNLMVMGQIVDNEPIRLY